MSPPTQKPSKVLETYRAMHARSAALYQRARGVIPGGVTHDGRHMTPFPVYIERAQGPRKWDVDGHEYVDYWIGHGALILGHCHPAVVAAIQRQAALATHPGACHEAEVRWAELVCQLVPSAEMVRFTMSGKFYAVTLILHDEFQPRLPAASRAHLFRDDDLASLRQTCGIHGNRRMCKIGVRL